MSNDRLLADVAERSVLRVKSLYPSFDEVRALENAARRARAKEMRRLLSSAIAFIRHKLERPGFAHS